MVKRDLLGTNLMIESDAGKAFNLDTIILSDFVRIPKGTKLVVDVGCGNGAILLYLSRKYKNHLLGIEIQSKRYMKALENIEMNHLQNQIEVIHADVKSVKLNQVADVIVSNPPFFKINDETPKSMDLDMLIAKHEVQLTLNDLIESVRINLKHGGLFFMVHKADRLDEIILALEHHDFKIKRMRFVHPNAQTKPNRVLIEAKYKASAHLMIEPPLIQYQENGKYSDEMQAIYQGRGYQK